MVILVGAEADIGPNQRDSVALPGRADPDQQRPQFVPVQFWGYNYCGPGNNGGPADAPSTDACCKTHDECYGKNHLSGKDVLMRPHGIGAGPAQKKFDGQLCNCVKSLGEASGFYDFRMQAGIEDVFCY